MKSVLNTLSAVFVAVSAITACAHSPSPAKARPVAKASAPQGPWVPDAEAVRFTFHADVEFTADERAQIHAAVEKWREQTHGLADIQVVYDLDFNSISSLRGNVENHVILRLDEEADIVKDFDCAHARKAGEPCGAGVGPRVLGFVYPPGGVTNTEDGPMRMGLVWDRMDPDGTVTMYGVVLHELGHALGISHLESRNSVMFPSYSGKRCLRTADLEAFCKVATCGNVQMLPCKEG